MKKKKSQNVRTKNAFIPKKKKWKREVNIKLRK